VLGLIVQRASGQGYFDYIREHVFERAGMADTNCYDPDSDVANRAVGYTTRDEQGQSLAGPRRNNWALLQMKGGPAGGGYGTVSDLLRFAVALQTHQLLNPATTDLVTTGKVESDMPGMRYAYGFMTHEVSAQAGHDNADLTTGLHQPGVAAQVEVVGAEVVVGVETDQCVEEAIGEGEGVRLCVDREDTLPQPRRADALPVVAAPIHRSVAQTCSPNSLAKKMELMARPQPMSSTRMPGWRSITWLSASASQTAFGPIKFSSIQTGS